VAHEDASLLIADLRELGIEREGAITVIPVDVALSRGITTMRSRQHDAGGSVVWEEVAARSSEWTELEGEYLVFKAMAGIIAAVGLLTDSVVLIIGAMIVGPDFGPMAGACVASAIVGVLVSVTTIPAIANAGVSAARRGPARDTRQPDRLSSADRETAVSSAGPCASSSTRSPRSRSSEAPRSRTTISCSRRRTATGSPPSPPVPTSRAAQVW